MRNRMRNVLVERLDVDVAGVRSRMAWLTMRFTSWMTGAWSSRLHLGGEWWRSWPGRRRRRTPGTSRSMSASAR